MLINLPRKNITKQKTTKQKIKYNKLNKFRAVKGYFRFLPISDMTSRLETWGEKRGNTMCTELVDQQNTFCMFNLAQTCSGHGEERGTLPKLW